MKSLLLVTGSKRRVKYCHSNGKRSLKYLRLSWSVVIRGKCRVQNINSTNMDPAITWLIWEKFRPSMIFKLDLYRVMGQN